jgi:hypothetical protein
VRGLPELVQPASVQIEVPPDAGGTLTYVDQEGLTTTAEIPPGALVQTTTLVLDALISPTFAFSPELCYAGHAFNLDTYCTVQARVFLPLVVKGFSQGAATGVPGAPELTGTLLNSEDDDIFACSVEFQKPLTITVHYSDEDIACLSEESALRLYYWTGSEWSDASTTCEPPSTYVHDLPGNALSLPVCHLSRYAIGGR